MTSRTTIGLALVGGAVFALAAMPPTAAHAQCSVFDRHPCVPSVCSVFQRGPCFPEFEPPIGQDLRLTIESRNAEGEGGGHKPEHDLNTLRELFAALRACWVPPAKEDARPGMQVSVRFSFKRNGEIIGKPRETYVSRDAPEEARKIYREAVAAALARCTPMPFTKGLGGALAGRPIAIRFTDNRT